jgi:hypothetical protein
VEALIKNKVVIFCNISMKIIKIKVSVAAKKERAAHQLPSNVNPQTHKQYRTYCPTNVKNFFPCPNIYSFFFEKRSAIAGNKKMH